MSTAAPPPAVKKAPPPPPGRPPVANGAAAPKRDFGVSTGVTAREAKVVMYGPGGVGKTELASLIKEVGVRPLFLDLEDGTKYLDVDRVTPAIETWDELRQVLHHEPTWAKHDAVVIDSLTRAEEMAAAWTIRNVKTDKGHFVSSLEGFGWGKGFTHLYETFLQLLGDLDAHIRAGRHVICIAHDCTAKVPNPKGEDFIRYEPRLQATDKGNIRARCKEWSDHLLYIGFDTFVSEDGKATGSGTRTIFPTELPTHWAKSRSLSDTIPYDRGSSELWQQLLGKGS